MGRKLMGVLALAPRCRPAELRAKLSLGMAHLSPAGLSEQWLLRHCGDQHWSLIAQALGQDSAMFRSPDGRAVYAAFATTSLRSHVVGQPLLGRSVTLASSLFAVSDTRTGSRHKVDLNGTCLAEVSMISTFVSHDDCGSNTRIFRNRVLGEMQLPAADPDLADLDQSARATSRRLRGGVVDDAQRVYSERPAPMLDFNAVGLLYFPTFSRIAETAACAHGAADTPVTQRDVVYLGNINQGDEVTVYGAGRQSILTRQDGAPIAVVQTRRASRA